MELVGFRFFFMILSLCLLFMCLLVPFTNIETAISSYPPDALEAAFLEQSLRLNLIGVISIACTLLEFVELFCAVSLLLR